MEFNINTDAAVDLTVKLSKLHRSALPVAVRSTLNDLAFETKKQIPRIATRHFVTRNKSFFRAFSSVDKAGGFSIRNMRSSVGITTAKGSHVAEGLAKQETGGAIRSRKLIPHRLGRVSGAHNKRLRRKHRFINMGKISTPQNKTQDSNYLLIKKGGRGTVFELRKAGKRTKLVPVYVYRNTRVSRVKKSPYMKQSTFIASKKVHSFYLKNAERQIKRLMK